MLNRIKEFYMSIIMSLIILLSGCGAVVNNPADTATNAGAGRLQVHFLDVGQADSALIITPSGQSILIDGGNNEDGEKIVNYLKSKGINELSAIVATHPHEDHIGGLDVVMQSIPTKKVYLPNAASSSRTFEDFIAAVKSSGAKKIEAKAGVKLEVPDLKGIFLAPNSGSYEELNNYSAVLKLTYGQVSFLFEGDAEDISEAEMIKSGQDLKATVLKIGHHGSKSSTTDEFLKAVSPENAIISVGSDNDYGHPAPSVINKLIKAGVAVYRTDQSGTIVVTTDGTSIEIDKNASVPSNGSASTKSSAADLTAKSTVELSNIDLSGEIVSIINSSNSTVDLTGWKLVSEVGNQTYTFPAGTTLAGGGTLKVVSGEKAQSGAGILVWTQSNIWNNDGDPGALFNAEGQLVSKR